MASTNGLQSAYPLLSILPIKSKHYRPQKQPSLPHTYFDIPDNITFRYTYEFSLERSIVDEAERVERERLIVVAAQEAKERREREKSPAIGREILRPVSLPPPSASSLHDNPSKTPSPIPPLDATALDRGSKSNSSSPEIPRQNPPNSTGTDKTKRPGINYLEFEQGLPPPDPWHTQDDDDDLRALKEVMGAPETKRTDSKPSQDSPSSQSTAHRANPHHRWSEIPQRVSENIDRARAAMAPSNVVDRARAMVPENIVDRARAMVANFHIGNTQPAGGPPPPPPKLPPASRKHHSTQYPVLPNISPTPQDEYARSRQQPPPTYTLPPGVPPDMQDLFVRTVQMGFPPDAVERAIQHCNGDEKKVWWQGVSLKPLPCTKVQRQILDFAIAYQEHQQAGFNGDDIVMALGLYNYDMKKERRFLEAFVALAEFGFPRERVREALVMKDNERDAALDYLMTG